jgi:hypothetical protein
MARQAASLGRALSTGTDQPERERVIEREARRRGEGGRGHSRLLGDSLVLSSSATP